MILVKRYLTPPYVRPSIQSFSDRWLKGKSRTASGPGMLGPARWNTWAQSVFEPRLFANNFLTRHIKKISFLLSCDSKSIVTLWFNIFFNFFFYPHSFIWAIYSIFDQILYYFLFNQARIFSHKPSRYQIYQCKLNTMDNILFLNLNILIHFLFEF